MLIRNRQFYPPASNNETKQYKILMDLRHEKTLKTTQIRLYNLIKKELQTKNTQLKDSFLTSLP